MNITALAVIPVRFFARPAKRVRAAGSWQGGRWVQGIPVITDIKAVLQGIKDEQMKLLSEGERVDDYRVIWTEADIKTADDDAETEADIVIDEAGQWWLIIQDGYRVESGFTRCIGKKIDERGRSLARD